MSNQEINLQWNSSGQPQPGPGALVEAGTPQTVVDIQKAAQPDSLSLESLPLQEREAVLRLKDRIDVSDSGAVAAFGGEPQGKVAAFSDTILKNVRTKDAGDAGKLLTDLVVQIKSFDGTSQEKGGFLGLFGGVKKQIDKMSAQYTNVENNVDKIVDSLEVQKRTLLKDVAMLDELYETNYIYFKELTLYIIAGKEKLTEIHEKTIPELQARAEQSRDEIDVQKFNDMTNYANRFEKKLHDLTLSRMISIQMAPQIRLLQNNDTQLVDKIQSSIVNAIPLWKNQIVIALALTNSKNALQSQKKVTDMTNDLLKKNSEMLKQGTLEVAQESERSIVSIETIRKTNQDLIETINGVIEIQQRGRQERQVAEAELVQLESQFKEALLTTTSRAQVRPYSDRT